MPTDASFRSRVPTAPLAASTRTPAQAATLNTPLAYLAQHDGELRFWLVMRLKDIGNLPGAATQVRALLADPGKCNIARSSLIRTLMEDEKYAEALTELDVHNAEHPYDAFAEYTRYRALDKLGDDRKYDALEQYLKHVDRRDPGQ